MTAIHPREALGIPGLVLVDLRPSSERYDQAALASIELGTPIARVASNLDHMLSRLPLVPGWSRVA